MAAKTGEKTMPRNYTSEIQTWGDARAYLGSKSERPLPHCSNLRIRWNETFGWSVDGDRSIVVTLHGNTIVRFPGPGLDKEFPYHGHFENTRTTKRHRSAFGGPREV